MTIAVDKNLDMQRALKVSRPSPGKEVLLAKILQAETASLLRLSHQNLMRIYAQGVLESEAMLIPFYVMDFVKGVKDADDYLLKSGLHANEVLTIFAGVLSAVEYLHDENTIHMDLKPENIFVTPRCIPVVADLGFAKQIRFNSNFTLIGGTEGYIHPDARSFVTEAQSDPNRLRGESPRTALRREWDFFSLGKTFLRLLSVLDTHNPRVLSSYQKRYLRLLSCRLLDGHNTEDERAVGLTRKVFEEIKYRDVKTARIDLEKLSGSYNLEARIPELSIYVADTIQASTLATTPFTPRVKKMVQHPLLSRLGDVTQLGLLNFIYPTATHNRLEHSIGTFSVLCRYVVAL